MLKAIIEADVKSMNWTLEDYTYKPIPTDGAYVCLDPDYPDSLGRISIIYGDDEEFEDIDLCQELINYPDDMETSWKEFFEILKEKLEGYTKLVYVNREILETFDIDNFDCYDIDEEYDNCDEDRDYDIDSDYEYGYD